MNLLLDKVYVVLVLALLAAVAAAGRAVQRLHRERAEARAQVDRQQLALAALGELALARGAEVAEIRSVVGPHQLQVTDQRPDATALISRIPEGRAETRPPSRAYAPGRAPVRREERR